MEHAKHILNFANIPVWNRLVKRRIAEHLVVSRLGFGFGFGFGFGLGLGIGLGIGLGLGLRLRLRLDSASGLQLGLLWLAYG